MFLFHWELKQNLTSSCKSTGVSLFFNKLGNIRRQRVMWEMLLFHWQGKQHSILASVGGPLFRAFWKRITTIFSQTVGAIEKLLLHPRGYCDISYIRRLESFFFGGGGVKSLNFNIFEGFQKNEYFGGYGDFVDIFWGSSQNWTTFWGHLLHISYFLKVNVQNGGIFWGC